ncbi:sulfotransferase family protein [Streptomyces sp. NPDC101733]|uniref:sulfotransferase family protein n=1 Tax=unclassified Streptomyces TaxID=2593676 RepID=UPI00382554BE
MIPDRARARARPGGARPIDRGPSGRVPSGQAPADRPPTGSRTVPGRSGEEPEPLDVATLRAEAVERTGLTDFGPDSHAPALDLLVTALNTEARLTPYGRAEARERLVSSLATRLWLYGRPPPPVDEEIWNAPVFIVGLPRTGSTLLHSLLACHPGLRAPRLWELLSPLSPPGREAPELIEAAEAKVAEDLRAAPEPGRIHPTSARSPEECEHLMNADFRNAVLGLISYRVPSYAAWLTEQDLTTAYRLHRAQLRHVLARRPAPPGARLVLKSPSHIWHLPSLAAVYPDARIIVLDREADAAVGSMCGPALAARRKRSDDVDPREIGRQLTAAGELALARSRAFTAEPPASTACLPVPFRELADAPEATAERVLAWLGLTETDEVRRGWRAHLGQHPRPPRVHPRALCGLPPPDGPRPPSPSRP